MLQQKAEPDVHQSWPSRLVGSGLCELCLWPGSRQPGSRSSDHRSALGWNGRSRRRLPAQPSSRCPALWPGNLALPRTSAPAPDLPSLSLLLSIFARRLVFGLPFVRCSSASPSAQGSWSSRNLAHSARRPRQRMLRTCRLASKGATPAIITVRCTCAWSSTQIYLLIPAGLQRLFVLQAAP